MMKIQSIFAIATVLMSAMLSACTEKDDEVVPQNVTVRVCLSVDNEAVGVSGVTVKMTDAQQSVFEAASDSVGVATFILPQGFYSASAHTKASNGNNYIVAGGYKDGITLTAGNADVNVDLPLVCSRISRLVIKELYTGGCPKDDASGTFSYDKYCILYNNSPEEMTIQNLCLAVVLPFNSNATNGFYGKDGRLSYADEDYLPIGQALWYMPHTVVVGAYEQKVIAFNNALDCTKTYSNSIDLSHADYVTYDNTFTTHTGQHPVPDSSIPTENYFRAATFSLGTGWSISKSSPAFIVFSTGDVDPLSIVDDEDNTIYMGNNTTANRCKKVKRQWIIDGIEVFNPSYTTNAKRITSDVDAGYAEYTADQGFSLYRNVDTERTLAIAGNEGLLVYGYMDNAEAIDAEASLANGAKIVFADTNNSTSDFHQRSKSSLKK